MKPSILVALACERQRDQNEERRIIVQIGAFWLSWRLGGQEHRLLNLLPPGKCYLPPTDLPVQFAAFPWFCWVIPTRVISRDHSLTFLPLPVGGAFPRLALNWDFEKLELSSSSGCGQAGSQWGLVILHHSKAWISNTNTLLTDHWRRIQQQVIHFIIAHQSNYSNTFLSRESALEISWKNGFSWAATPFASSRLTGLR